MTNGQREAHECGPQDETTIPATKHEAITGHMEDDLKRQAYQAGEVVIDPGHVCRDCDIYKQEGEHNNNPDCDICRTNPEHDEAYEVDLLINWLLIALTEVQIANINRRERGDSYHCQDYQDRTREALRNIDDDHERLMTIHSPPDAEQLSGEVGVEQTLNQGGKP